MTLLSETNNALISSWTDDTRKKLIQEANRLNIKFSPGSAFQRLPYKFKRSGGEITRISFVVPRHAIFVHKGVGKGTNISQVGSNNRKPKPWFSPIIDDNLDDLAEQLAENSGDIILKSML